MIGSRKSLAQTYPHVDPRWMEDLLLSLRLRELSGRRIGEVMAEANAHCEASGEDAREAFGAPEEYAKSLDFPGQQRAARRVESSDLWWGGAMVLGGALASWGGSAAVQGQPMTLHLGHLGTVALLVGLFAVVVHRLEWVLTHLVAVMVFNGLATAAMVGLLLWKGPKVLSVSSVGALVLGYVVLIVGATLKTRSLMKVGDDIVIIPGQETAMGERRRAAALGVAGVWMPPLVLAAFLLMQGGVHI
ncbi:hypothetical protein [Austwickia chelonae]|uniref:hypothetical protein n=1 Tax=Austwickia chelonae TaxID=100225 RepID=UPI000E248F0F|nr:hypothetical protein [Austwickia chelonae]